MNTLRSFVAKGLLSLLVIGLGACGSLSPREKGTAVGAGVGAVGGAVLSGGSAIGTLGGAAVGGVIGNQVSKDK
jgi:osmotically inducible lipoprotein OsmB